MIDSRVSQRCPNGLIICEQCGSCCSHDMQQRRLTGLEAVGGYIHDSLRRCVTEKLAHLDRAEYFCYKCKNAMIEISKDVFYCASCERELDTNKYNFKRQHRHLRETDEPYNGHQDDELDLPI